MEDQDEWMMLFESYKTQIDKVQITNKTDMSKVDLIIHIFSSLPEDHKVTVGAHEDCLTGIRARA